MIYIHIPFCKSKCIYCDFYSGGNPSWQRYVKAVANELDQRIHLLEGSSLSSVYIGGGTPSLLPAESFRAITDGLFSTLRDHEISLDPKLEFTIEVNPEDVTSQMASMWKDCGVNRVSMGVQTLDNGLLSFLRRRHSAQKALEALKILRENFSNISVDVIYGIPGQSASSLETTLSSLLKFRPEHISAYALTYEEKTPLSLFRERGEIIEAPEDEYLAHDRLISEILDKSGYERYEISNYALPGCRSRHNSGYWSGLPYLGLGPSAASYDGSRRRVTNLPDLRSYLSYYAAEHPVTLSPPITSETLTNEEMMEERIFTALRTADGLDLDAFSSDFGASSLDTILANARPFLSDSLRIVESQSSKRLSFTPSGFLISDYILPRLIP